MAVVRHENHHRGFLVGILLFLFYCHESGGVRETLGTCGTTIDLITSTNHERSGILKVGMPKSLKEYQGLGPVQKDCEMIIMFGAGYHLQIELYYLNIMPESNNVAACGTGLEVYDGNNRQVYAGRMCMEGWEWEERHRKSKQEKKIVENSPLRFRLVSEGPYRGTGFKVHFNQFRPSWTCYPNTEFKCERLQRCVSEDLTCDDWDDCGDHSDESEDAGCELLTVSEIFAVIIGILLLLCTVIATVIFLIKYRRIIKRNSFQRKESKLKLAMEEERRSVHETSVSFPHRFQSMESINKSQHSRTPGQKMDLESLMDRMELDKADKYSYRDNMSERSYKSKSERHRSNDNASDRYGPSKRRSKAASQSSLTKDKTGSQGDLDRVYEDVNAENREPNKYENKGRSRYSDDDDDYDSDRDRRQRSRDRRRRSRERPRYSDDDDYDDYDSDRDRRRRRSRERPRYSDDDDYDSDRDRRRRNRDRRSRERPRYSDDDDYDSDRDRRGGRDRRSRERPRYSDDDDDYDSDRGRRRRNRDRRRSKERSRHSEEDKSGSQADIDRDKEKGREDEKDANKKSNKEEPRYSNVDKPSSQPDLDGDNKKGREKEKELSKERNEEPPRPTYAYKKSRPQPDLDKENEKVREKEKELSKEKNEEPPRPTYAYNKSRPQPDLDKDNKEPEEENKPSNKWKSKVKRGNSDEESQDNDTDRRRPRSRDRRRSRERQRNNVDDSYKDGPQPDFARSNGTGNMELSRFSEV